MQNRNFRGCNSSETWVTMKKIGKKISYRPVLADQVQPMRSEHNAAKKQSNNGRKPHPERKPRWADNNSHRDGEFCQRW
jgi:hypothetical protein